MTSDNVHMRCIMVLYRIQTKGAFLYMAFGSEAENSFPSLISLSVFVVLLEGQFPSGLYYRTLNPVAG